MVIDKIVSSILGEGTRIGCLWHLVEAGQGGY